MMLFFKFIIDSQSGMWMFRRDILAELEPQQRRHGALARRSRSWPSRIPSIRCLEMPIYYGERIGESKLNLWRDGFGNLFFARASCG